MTHSLLVALFIELISALINITLMIMYYITSRKAKPQNLVQSHNLDNSLRYPLHQQGEMNVWYGGNWGLFQDSDSQSKH